MRTKINDALSLLAPGAGSGMGAELAARILSRPDWLDLCEAAIVHGLTAQMRFFDKAANDGKGGFVIMQDAKTQVATVTAIWSHIEGDPVKRIVHEVHGDPDVAAAADEQLASSPGLRAAMRRRLDAAERAAKSLPQPEPKRVEAIDLPE